MIRPKTRCLMPFLGSGPDVAAPGSGYLTRADYIEILKAAKARQIEVIPSFDMPGHSRAAILAMKARARRLIAEGKPEEAARYRLDEPDDKTVYSSIQHYNDNTLNVCLPSTYAFIGTVIDSLKAMHEEAGLPLAHLSYRRRRNRRRLEGLARLPAPSWPTSI